MSLTATEVTCYPELIIAGHNFGSMIDLCPPQCIHWAGILVVYGKGNPSKKICRKTASQCDHYEKWDAGQSPAGCLLLSDHTLYRKKKTTPNVHHGGSQSLISLSLMIILSVHDFMASGGGRPMLPKYSSGHFHP